MPPLLHLVLSTVGFHRVERATGAYPQKAHCRQRTPHPKIEIVMKVNCFFGIYQPSPSGTIASRLQMIGRFNEVSKRGIS